MWINKQEYYVIILVHVLCSVLPGWYCLSGAIQTMPTDPLQGGRCPRGAYCPEGSQNYTECDPGMYCQIPGMAAPSGNCSQGKQSR